MIGRTSPPYGAFRILHGAIPTVRRLCTGLEHLTIGCALGVHPRDGLELLVRVAAELGRRSTSLFFVDSRQLTWET